MSNVFEIAGEVSAFGFRAAGGLFRRPFEGDQIRRQLAEVGAKSLPLVIASGFALGAVLTLHTRSTLVTFGATAWIPTVHALAFFLEIGLFFNDPSAAESFALSLQMPCETF